MKRREFIQLVGGAAVASPLVARAQRPAMPVIRLLGADTAAAQSRWTTAFVQRLRELGWTEGRNIEIQYRWGEGRPDRFREFAAEFVRSNVSVILTNNTPPTHTPPHHHTPPPPRSRRARGARTPIQALSGASPRARGGKTFPGLSSQ